MARWMRMMKRLVKEMLLKMGVDLTDWRSWLYEKRAASRALKTYSQYGEDACLRGFMDVRCRDRAYRGFWVDVGAHHPTRFSNTRMFSEMGWTGINVDAMSDAMDLFRKRRPRDVNVNVGIGDASGELTYYLFPDHAYNTFVKARVDELAREWGRELVEGLDYQTRKVPVITLKELLDRYLPKGQKIDFLTIDAEGMDLAILKSNDWSRYRPDFVLAEVLPASSGGNILESETARYLCDMGYRFAGQCASTTIFLVK